MCQVINCKNLFRITLTIDTWCMHMSEVSPEYKSNIMAKTGVPIYVCMYVCMYVSMYVAIRHPYAYYACTYYSQYYSLPYR